MALDLSSLGWLGAGDPSALGWSGANLQPDDETLAQQTKAATAQLAARMRQQSQSVELPPGADTFADRFAGKQANSADFTSSPFAARFGSLAPSIDPSGPGAPLNIAPDLATLPANSTPTQGMAPSSAVPAAPPQQQSADPSLLDKFGAGLANFGYGARTGGLLGAISGAIEGDTTGRRIDPIGQQNQTIDYLQRKGYSADDARAIASNPDVLKAVLPQAVGMQQLEWTTIGQNPYGQPVYGFVNQRTKEVFDVNGKPINQQNSPGSAQAAADPNLHGEDYLKTLDPSRANLIRSIGQGQQAFPSGFLLKTPYGEMLQTQVTQAYPDVNAQTFPQRQKAFNDWYGGGRDQEAVRSVTQASTHALDLIGSMQRLGNYPIGGALVNKPLNEIGNAIGTNTEYGPTQLNVHALADELSKIWKGGNNSDTEVRAWEEKFPVNGTPDQQKAAMGKALELYRGGIDSLERKRQDALGPVANTLPKVLDPKTEATLTQMENWSRGGAARPTTTAQPTAAAPGAPGGQINPTDALAQARNAIARGANRTQVILRLQQNGISTGGL